MPEVTGPSWWRPDQFVRRRGFLEKRALVLASLRARFDAEGFVEVDTPALQVSPGLEPHLKAFATVWVTPDGEERVRYLHTSPEFAMKKLLVAGMSRIYQLGHVFRNAECGPTHSPEFTMLEWYRSGAPLPAVMEDAIELARTACQAADSEELMYRGRRCDPFAEPERLTVAEAFARHCGIDLLATAPDPGDPDLALFAEAAAPIGVAPHPGDRWEDLFFRIMLDRIEPHLGEGRLTLLHDYPLALAALARPSPTDPRVAERFELYGCGVELANGFGELTDAKVQAARFEADMALKELLYAERYPIDEDFLAALGHGLPDSAGVALGFDRLVMLATGAPDIESVLWAPVR